MLQDANNSLDAAMGSLDALFAGLARIRDVLGLDPPEYPADTRDILSAVRALEDLRAEVGAYLNDPDHPGEYALAEALDRCRP